MRDVRFFFHESKKMHFIFTNKKNIKRKQASKIARLSEKLSRGKKRQVFGRIIFEEIKLKGSGRKVAPGCSRTFIRINQVLLVLLRWLS